MHICRFNELSVSLDLSNDFLTSINNSTMNESDKKSDEGLFNKIVRDLKLNTGIVLSFGTAMECMIPIVKKLCENGEFKIELTIENLALMTLTAVTVAYLEEAKDENKEQLTKDAKSLLEELKLRGIGNNLIKKLVKCFMSIGYISKLLLKHKKNIIASFFEMLGYAAICVPILNGIKAIVGNYDMTLDNFSNNMASLLLGLSSLSSKNIFKLLTKATKDDKDKNNNVAGDIIDSNYDPEKGAKLIKEQ